MKIDRNSDPRIDPRLSTFCRRIIATTRYIAGELQKIDGIYIIGDPEVSVVAIGDKS
jgi:glutamate/tyrosine decarboxylase-like PLP-dependent enzyme